MGPRSNHDDVRPPTTDPRPEATAVVPPATAHPDSTQGAPGAPGSGRDARRGRPSPLPAQMNGRPNGQGAGPTNGQDRANGRDRAYGQGANGQDRANGQGINGQGANGQDRANGCTAPQLRRFIKSRPYVPMHELRRRFAIDGGDDDVTQVSIEQGHVYVGLPSREGGLLGELLRGGEIGYELSLDPCTPVVVGVYPMRPIPRS